MKPDFLKNEANGVYRLTKDIHTNESSPSLDELKTSALSDELVNKLPRIPKTHVQFKEWKKRKNTLNRFLRYLKLRPAQKIIEIGCGNGWFAHQISKKSEFTIGLDINQHELEQAERCFSSKKLNFVYCNDLKLIPKNTFDFIVFNASIQYFDLNDSFWQHLNQLLTKNGEIHILDTPISSLRALEQIKLKEGTDLLTNALHVSWQHLPSGYDRLFKPTKFWNLIFRNRSSCPWIVIYKKLN